MSADRIDAPMDDGPILLPHYKSIPGRDGVEVMIPGTELGLEHIRRGDKESIRFIERDGEGGIKEILEFDSLAPAGGVDGFGDALCRYLSRMGYVAALAHPLARGIAVKELAGPRMLARVDMRTVSRMIDEDVAMRDAYRHFGMLREAYLVRDWWQGKETCWVNIAPGYDFRHMKAIFDVEPPEIREGQRAMLQLCHYESRYLGVKGWEPRVILTLDQAPVYDLKTDTIPGLELIMLPGSELNRGHDCGTDRLVRDLLRVMPNDDEPFRWRSAAEHAMRGLPVIGEEEDAPAPC